MPTERMLTKLDNRLFCQRDAIPHLAMHEIL